MPGSVLWLLRPSRHSHLADVIQNTLQAEAAARGISPERVVFADRVDKVKNLMTKFVIASSYDHQQSP